MVQNSAPDHHIHKRKRIHEKHEKYPHPNKWKRMLDKAIYAIAFIGPIMTIPQVLKIWLEQNATGVSSISWTTYLILSVFWFVYGCIHKEKPIMISGFLFIVVKSIIVVGILLYGYGF
ncbi:MAG: hypothetical protein ISS36_04175 [Candidatus Aenigmarchaeota archaeon]|nr:hypothetical protein [Candidatus Aenigmarchaeota archaeon]